MVVFTAGEQELGLWLVGLRRDHVAAMHRLSITEDSKEGVGNDEEGEEMRRGLEKARGEVERLRAREERRRELGERLERERQRVREERDREERERMRMWREDGRGRELVDEKMMRIDERASERCESVCMHREDVDVDVPWVGEGGAREWMVRVW